MRRAVLNTIELEYEIRGSGEPIVFVHHGAGADWFKPLLEDPSLNLIYRLVHYHRAGYAGSSRLETPLTFAQEARNFRALMHHLGLERVHLVGHSASACIALQIALDSSDCVHSIGLLEPALMAVPSPPEVPQALELYRKGDIEAAVDTFLRGTCGAHARAVLGKVVPGAVEQALAGRSADDSLADAVRDADVAAHLAPIDDVRGSAAYRAHAAAELIRRALAQALAPVPA